MRAGTKRALIRAGMLILLVLSIDGAITWYATDQAAATVEEIQLRDGLVATDDTTLGMMHRTELELAVGDDDGRLARARYLWLVGAAAGLAAVVLSGSVHSELARTVVLSGAITVAIAVAPRLAYADELGSINAVFG